MFPFFRLALLSYFLILHFVLISHAQTSGFKIIQDSNTYLYGIKNSQGEWIIYPQYRRISPTAYPRFVKIQTDSGVGIYDIDRREIAVPPRHAKASIIRKSDEDFFIITATKVLYHYEYFQYTLSDEWGHSQYSQSFEYRDNLEQRIILVKNKQLSFYDSNLDPVNELNRIISWPHLAIYKLGYHSFAAIFYCHKSKKYVYRRRIQQKGKYLWLESYQYYDCQPDFIPIFEKNGLEWQATNYYLEKALKNKLVVRTRENQLKEIDPYKGDLRMTYSYKLVPSKYSVLAYYGVTNQNDSFITPPIYSYLDGTRTDSCTWMVCRDTLGDLYLISNYGHIISKTSSPDKFTKLYLQLLASEVNSKPDCIIELKRPRANLIGRTIVDSFLLHRDSIQYPASSLYADSLVNNYKSLDGYGGYNKRWYRYMSFITDYAYTVNYQFSLTYTHPWDQSQIRSYKQYHVISNNDSLLSFTREDIFNDSLTLLHAILAGKQETPLDTVDKQLITQRIFNYMQLKTDGVVLYYGSHYNGQNNDFEPETHPSDAKLGLEQLTEIFISWKYLASQPQASEISKLFYQQQQATLQRAKNEQQVQEFQQFLWKLFVTQDAFVKADPLCMFSLPVLVKLMQRYHAL